MGSPNAGKTTLFNALTGLRAKTANYPGVTVTRRIGEVRVEGRTVQLEDLPGTYSLEPASPDEQVVVDSLVGADGPDARPDGLIIVADVTTLRRSLILIAQALALGLPSVLAVTMIDEFDRLGGSVDLQRLSAALGVEVVGVVPTKGRGLETVRGLLAAPGDWPVPVLPPPSEPAEMAAWIDSVLTDVVHVPSRRSPWTERVDRVLLHPVIGTLIFAVVMVTFFQIIFAWAAPLSDAIDSFFVWLGGTVGGLIGWEPLARFVADGLIAGVGAVLVFLPQILLLFVMLSFLENVGYMARAAILMDRLMGVFGLEGRSFVALLSSYACAIPGIMATRSIPASRQRLATILISPLMTCSARLPVYTLFIAAFVPNVVVIGPLRLQGLVMLGLYLLGAVTAMIVSTILTRAALSGTRLPFFMELPPYRLPGVKHDLTQTWDSARHFVRKAGTIILATTAVLWVLLNVPAVEVPPSVPANQVASYQMENSIAGTLGRAMEPVFSPLGFDWEINVALLSSFAAREVFVSTLGQISAAEGDDDQSISAALQSQTWPDGSPVYTPGTVAAILLFFVFALQCMSTIAVMRRETNSWRWPLVAFVYLSLLAYSAAWIGNRVVTAIVGG
ncbi:MAG: ferrous iron transporter B [Actinobacteria bacterium]|nr:ferrous iron transporter B [Actinomycetota bacterium]